MTENHEQQTIHFYMDDSGVFCSNDEIFVYGGLYFLDNKEMTKFSNFYNDIVEKFRHKHCKKFKNLNTSFTYCSNSIKKQCKSTCPELKSTTLNPTELRSFLNHIKKL